MSGKEDSIFWAGFLVGMISSLFLASLVVETKRRNSAKIGAHCSIKCPCDLRIQEREKR